MLSAGGNMRSIARFVLFALAIGFAGAGCRAQVRGTATVTAPELVLIQGDVWVVERYQEPVFYTEGYYWRWYGSVWYRSTVHTGGWVQVSVGEVPASVKQVPQPESYANYVAPANATKRTGPPDHAPAHGVRGTQPGHDGDGPPGHSGDGPPGHSGDGPPGHAGGPPNKDDKGPPPGAGGPPNKDDKGPPPGAGGPPDKDKDKAGGPAKDAKPADSGPPKDKGGGGDKGGDKGGSKADDKKGGKK
jgi:hypothetical protein